MTAARGQQQPLSVSCVVPLTLQMSLFGSTDVADTNCSLADARSVFPYLVCHNFFGRRVTLGGGGGRR
jgi:hypothetical protein